MAIGFAPCWLPPEAADYYYYYRLEYAWFSPLFFSDVAATTPILLNLPASLGCCMPLGS